MTPRTRVKLITLLAVSLAVPAVARGQLLERPASINGKSITVADVYAHAGLVSQELAGLNGEQLFHVTRRKIAEEILLASEAERSGVILDQRQVDAYWKNRNGSSPDYELLASHAGTSVARQKQLAHRAALASLYLHNKTGLRTDFGPLVPPDPMLVRTVRVTPTQLREAFKAYKSHLDRPAMISTLLYVCRDEAEVSAVMLAHAAGTEPIGVSSMPRSYPTDRLEQIAEPELLPFLRSGKEGEIRRFDTEQGTLLVVLVAREPPREAVFSEVQAPLRNLLVTELLSEAQQHLVKELAQRAKFWPNDLFRPPPTSTEGLLVEPPR